MLIRLIRKRYDAVNARIADPRALWVEFFAPVLGAFETLKEAHWPVATINDPHGTMAVSEYYVCGLGLLRAEQTIEEWYQRHGKKRTALLELSRCSSCAKLPRSI